VLEAKLALAEDHVQVDSDRWRPAVLQSYYVAVGAIGVALLVFIPPTFDLRPLTLASVAFVAAFLAITERPTQSAGKAAAPMTAVVVASAVVFGSWTLVVVLTALAAVRVRLSGERSEFRELLTTAFFCQAGAGIIATYGMISAWTAATALEAMAPVWTHFAIAFVAVVCLGFVWQSVVNGVAHLAFALLGRPVNALQFLRVGAIASLYAYLLIGIYTFGGIFAAALFYMLVARTRAIEDIVGVTRSLNQLEHARGQATGVMRELMRFTDLPDAQFSGEVENIAQMLARHMGMPRKEVIDVGLAAELHEIGKCRLPARLRRSNCLNASELAQAKTYSRLGAIMLRSADALIQPEIANSIEYHTEHFDGTGYPKGLSGDTIPLASRIVALARGYVCLLTGYDGAPRVGKEEALRLLRQNSGTLYDPRLVDLLAELVN
jgi:hypothetical protein